MEQNAKMDSTAKEQSAKIESAMKELKADLKETMKNREVRLTMVGVPNEPPNEPPGALVMRKASRIAFCACGIRTPLSSGTTR